MFIRLCFKQCHTLIDTLTNHNLPHRAQQSVQGDILCLKPSTRVKKNILLVTIWLFPMCTDAHNNICFFFLQRWMTPGKKSASILELSHTWIKQGAFLIGKKNCFFFSFVFFISLLLWRASLSLSVCLSVCPLGGCCRIGPAHIKELRQQLKGSCTSAASAEWLDWNCYSDCDKDKEVCPGSL